MVEDAGNQATKLPPTGKTSAPGPITNNEINSGRMIPKIPFSRKQIGVIKKLNKYGKTGEINKDIKKQAIKTGRVAVGVDDQGRTILERPWDLYRYGFRKLF